MNNYFLFQAALLLSPPVVSLTCTFGTFGGNVQQRTFFANL